MRRKRPRLVWVIAVYQFLAAVWTTLALLLIVGGAVPLAPPQRAYFDDLGSLELWISIGLAMLNIAASAALLLLRRAAVFFTGVALMGGVFFSVQQLLMNANYRAVLRGPELLGTIIGLAISTAIFLYSRRLQTQGVLA